MFMETRAYCIHLCGYVQTLYCQTVKIRLTLLSPFSKGVMYVVYMETRVHSVRLCGYI